MLFMKALRIEKEWTQQDVSRATGIKRGDIIAIERGVMKADALPPKKRVRLEKLFGFSSTALWGTINIVQGLMDTPYFFLTEGVDRGDDQITLLKYLRKQSRLLQRTAAYAMGVSSPTLNKLENVTQLVCRTDPEILKKIEDFYGVASVHFQIMVSPFMIEIVQWKQENQIRRYHSTMIVEMAEKIRKQEDEIKRLRIEAVAQEIYG